jgi:glutamate-1-semialdehyde 2,1-aminomutase
MAARRNITASRPISARWARSSAAAIALAAIAGRADIMAHFDRLAMADEDFLFQVGTLSGNPVAAVAGPGHARVLKRPGAYEQVFATGRELMAALDELLKKAGIKAR